jgi:CMP-N-acetylneuraminic acid synthetase
MSKEKKRILAVVPARGGSKGIKLKNLKKINGKSLIQIVSEVILKSKIFTNAVVSTDNNLIRKEALKFGLDVPFIRPKSLSGDFISDVEVLRHALKKSESFYKVNYDYIMMLQPTSPLRTKKDLLKLTSMMNKKKYDAVWTISETDLKFHPLKQLKINDGSLNYWDSKGKNIIARQQLNPVYHRNGVGYIISRECLVKKNSIKGNKTGFLLVKTPQISIDTVEDLKKAEMIKKS